MGIKAGGRDGIKWKKFSECSFPFPLSIIAQCKCSIPKLWAQLEIDMYDHTRVRYDLRIV